VFSVNPVRNKALDLIKLKPASRRARRERKESKTPVNVLTEKIF